MPFKFYKGTCIFDTCEIEDIEKMEIRADDIWVLSFPRSGTTLTQEIVYLLKNKLDFEAALKTALDERFPFLDIYYPSLPYFRGLKYIEQLKGPRMIKSHLHYHLLPEQLFQSKCKKVYVMRNPKDVIVSNLMLKKTLCIADSSLTTALYLDNFLDGKEHSTPWWLHVHDFWLHRDDPNILIVFYETLVKDMPGGIRQIADHLEVSVTDTDVQQIAGHCSFSAMQANKSVNCYWQKQVRKWDDSFGGFIRKGKVGGWRNHFSNEMSEKVDRMVEEKLGELNIPFDYGH